MFIQDINYSMDESSGFFLNQLANVLLKKYGQSISGLTIIFPNRRSGLFFTEYLNRIIQQPTFAPETVTIQDLFGKFSSLEIEEEMLLVFRLFKIYKDLSRSNESFDDFFLWGEMLLNDFDQVDKYLVDPELLFANITNLKEIDEYFSDWNPERKEVFKQFWKSIANGEDKQNQREFAQLWEVLLPVYLKFKKELQSEGVAFEGMLFRSVVEDSNLLSRNYLKDRRFIVAGFNALNSCEKKLFQLLKDNTETSFYWDYDDYYLNDLNQEAGYFMRENLISFPQEDDTFRRDGISQSKKIKIFYTPSQMGQAQLAAKEVNKYVERTSVFDDTAIVLCDEELLLPVLLTLPEKVNKVNVTMGLPLTQTPLFTLINTLIKIQKDVKSINGQTSFHYKCVHDLVNNQLIQAIYPNECKVITDRLVSNNLVYLSISELCFCKLFDKIFVNVETVSEMPGYFLSVLNDLFLYWENCPKSKYSFNYQEHIYQTYLSVNKLNNALFLKGRRFFGSANFLSKETFYRIFLQYLSTLTISFEGEPLAGLQVMGILETRTLDFKNLILLSVNEGIMPRANMPGSFIPYHLRRGVGLPTIEEQNAMYAFYFYRLLQRSHSISFIYNSGNNGSRTGEKSRFLHQLQLESPFEIEEFGVESNIEPAPFSPIVIEKRGKVLTTLNRIIEEGHAISPTSLDQFILCPLSYYFKYIAGIKEEDELMEELDPRVFGKIFHSVMESVYKPFAGKTVDAQTLLSTIENENHLQSVLLHAFKIHFFKSEEEIKENMLAGRNKLVAEVIKKSTVQTLRNDLDKTPFVVFDLEKKVSANLQIFNNTRVVRIGGVIDRIDSLLVANEIVDYKTGISDNTFYDLASLFEENSIKRNKAAFQTMVYSWIWAEMYPETKTIFPAIYGLRNMFKLSNNRLRMKIRGDQELNFVEVKDEFEKYLRILLESIFDPSTPFRQTTAEENCLYCMYSSICRKTNG